MKVLLRNPRREIEVTGPTTVAALLLSVRGFADSGSAPVILELCTECGAPTPAEVCAFCRLRTQAGAMR